MSTEKVTKYTTDQNDANLDPISGEPGAHPVGTGAGAAGAGSVGTVIGGVLGGPVGAVVGAVVGSVAGGLAGKAAAESMDPTNFDDSYWRETYATRPYVSQGSKYEDFELAYRIGYEGYALYAVDGDYNAAESKLRRDYEKANGTNAMAWDTAKHAVKDSWEQAAAVKN